VSLQPDLGQTLSRSKIDLYLRVPRLDHVNAQGSVPRRQLSDEISNRDRVPAIVRSTGFRKLELLEVERLSSAHVHPLASKLRNSAGRPRRHRRKPGGKIASCLEALAIQLGCMRGKPRPQFAERRRLVVRDFGRELRDAGET